MGWLWGVVLVRTGPYWSVLVPYWFCRSSYGAAVGGRYWSIPVRTESPRAPSLFPLVSCASPVTQDLYSVGCAALDFLPDHLDISWSNSLHRNVTDGVRIFPVVPVSGRYSAATSLTLPLVEGKSQQPFYCRVAHRQGTATIAVSNHDPVHQVPLVTLHPPSREDFEGPYRNSSLLCQIRGPREVASIRWLKNGVHLQDGVTTETAALEGKGVYVTDSRVIVTESEWDAGTVYTCQVEEELRNTSKALECGYNRPDGGEEIAVRVVPPVFADIFKDKVAKLTCKVANLPTVDGLVISWWKENGEKLETKTSARVLQPNSLYSVDGVASVCADEWDKGEVYTCKVTHPELLFPTEVKLQKTMGSSSSSCRLHPPLAISVLTVFILLLKPSSSSWNLHPPPQTFILLLEPSSSSSNHLLLKPSSSSWNLHPPPQTFILLLEPSSSSSNLHPPPGTFILLLEPSSSSSNLHPPPGTFILLLEPSSSSSNLHPPPGTFILLLEPSSSSSNLHPPPGTFILLLEPSSSSWNLHPPPGTFILLLKPSSSSWNLHPPPPHSWNLHPPPRLILLKPSSSSWNLHPPPQTFILLLEPSSSSSNPPGTFILLLESSSSSSNSLLLESSSSSHNFSLTIFILLSQSSSSSHNLIPAISVLAIFIPLSRSSSSSWNLHPPRAGFILPVRSSSSPCKLRPPLAIFIIFSRSSSPSRDLHPPLVIFILLL
ncbi:matrix metalloproteinase-14-like [Grus japonensis]|uniref:Matrix metalloproteinase-14-like n=1 Tax=Grus japonensis TaxID=30415 RepID=A0ABC9XY56_GRUJA